MDASKMEREALDPFCGHEWNLKKSKAPAGTAGQYQTAGSGMPGSGMFSTKKMPDQEMQNRVERGDLKMDPFMTKYGAASERPRVKVSVYSASDLPTRGERLETYCTISVPGVTKSRLNTPVDYQNWNNPVWNFTEKQVWGWLPGKALQFEVKNKAAKTGAGFSAMLGMTEDLVLGTALLPPELFWPDNYKMQAIELFDQYGNMAGKVWVEINCFGGAANNRGCCHWLSNSLSYFGDGLASIPMVIGILIKQCFDMLKPEYPARRVSEMAALIGVPYGVYCFILLLLCVLRRFIHTLCNGILVFMILFFLGMFGWSLNRKKSALGMPYSVLSGFCLLACALGIFAGNECWDFGFRQWIWLNTGHQYGVKASSSPGAAVDAAFITFDAETRVDTNMGAGFRVNHQMYCAAPMLDPTSMAAENPRVSFWAIGINCCGSLGHFTCDASRELAGGTGVVMLDRGMPCATCNREEFRLAVAKAAGANGIVSDPNSLYVKYVENKSVVEVTYGFRSIGILFFYLLLGFCIFFTLGYIANFQGWGKPAAVEERNAALRQTHHLNPLTKFQNAKSRQPTDSQMQRQMEDRQVKANSNTLRLC